MRSRGYLNDAPELDLWRRLAAYGELRRRRIATLPAQKAALAKLAFVGLQQRLLSSIAAFLRTPKHEHSFVSLNWWKISPPLPQMAPAASEDL